VEMMVSYFPYSSYIVRVRVPGFRFRGRRAFLFGSNKISDEKIPFIIIETILSIGIMLLGILMILCPFDTMQSVKRIDKRSWKTDNPQKSGSFFHVFEIMQYE
jgi:hypothetical protein